MENCRGLGSLTRKDLTMFSTTRQVCREGAHQLTENVEQDSKDRCIDEKNQGNPRIMPEVVLRVCEIA